MIKPLFVIQHVSTYQPKNRAQVFVIDAMSDLEFKTLADASALARFERHLKTVVKMAHDMYPRTTAMQVRRYDGVRHLNKIEVIVPSDKGEHTYVMIIDIAVLQGEWKGGEI